VTYHEGGSYEEPTGFQTLQQELARREGASASSAAGRLFYLALPPTVYPPVMKNIKCHCSNLTLKGCSEEKSWVRVVVEKPFGRDLESSEELAAKVAQLFTEDQVYRIDHFLGKELTQVHSSHSGAAGCKGLV
jgi:glucose-6-phosphate 1-dehydrogenase